MSRRSAAILSAIAGVVGLILYLQPREASESSPPASTIEKPTHTAPPPATPFPGERIRLPSADLAERLNDPAESPAEDLAIVDLLITDFRRHFSGNPVGENDEITAALTGHNPKGLVYLPPDHPAIDSQGRLTDRWGSPYFFHAVAADRMEISSPGPDREPHTADDLTLAR
jgi:hypothetical protein